MSWIFRRHQGGGVATPSAHRQQDGSRCGHGDGSIGDGFVLCCLPSGCPRRLDDPIDPVRPVGAVRVSCSDQRCDVGSRMMHGDCFADWEEEVLAAYLCCSNGRGRSWSDGQQRNQNEWLAQKSCDPLYNACLCMCGRGYLRRNLDNVRVVGDRDALPGKPPSTREPQGLCIDTVDFKPPQHHHHNHDHRHYHHGLRRSSLSSSPGSSGSSPASSTTGTPASTSPGSGCWLFNSPPPPPPRRTAEFFADGQQAARGSIFARRTDMAVFSSLPRHAWNTYNIRSEDEGPHGTDETRSFLLTILSTRGITCVDCAVCRASMTVYDTYPLVDGTFYLSPVRCDDSSILVTHRDRPRYLSAVCVSCMTGGAKARLQCRACGTPWNGSVLVVGSMYAYDVFAAAPCCPARLACNRCDLEVAGRNGASPQSYSDYSRSYVCPHCNADDYHFVKPLGHVYLVAQQ